MQHKKIRYIGNFLEYHYVNALIASIVLLLLLLVKFNWFAVHCIYAQHGSSCTTCGLTTYFHFVLSGQYTTNRPDFAALFILFAGQLFIRPLVSFLFIKTQRFILIRNVDIAVTVALLIAYLVL